MLYRAIAFITALLCAIPATAQPTAGPPISQLPNAQPLTGGESVPVVQQGQTRKTPTSSFQIVVGPQALSVAHPATVQGNGEKMQLSTGAFGDGQCVQFDSAGNTVPTGSPCGAGGGGPPTGPASGDLCNVYPDPSVCKILGSAAGANFTVVPSRNKDLIADFAFIPLTQWGVAAASVQLTAGSKTVHCTFSCVTAADATNADVFIASNANTGSVDFISFITGYTDSTDFTINDAPAFTTINTKVIDRLVPDTQGLGYSFTGVQTLVGGTIQTASTGSPKLMTVGDVRVNTAGTGGSSGSGCLVMALNPTANTGGGQPPGLGALQGLQATIIPTISGGGLTGVAVGNGNSYRSFTGYTYSSGWYLNIPLGPAPGVVSTTCPTGATVDIRFAVVEEGLAPNALGRPAANGYDATLSVPNGLPCSGSVSATTSSSDSGSGLKLFCPSTHVPQNSFGYDNTTKLASLLDDSAAASAANDPYCYHIPTRWFMVKPIAASSHAFHGFGCAYVDAELQGGFAIIPDNGNTYPTTLGKQVLACVDCNGNSAQSPVTLQLTDPNSPLRAGFFVRNVTCIGYGTSSTLDDCGTTFGKLQWPDMDMAAWNITGHVFDTAISASSGTGTIAETTKCLYFRTEQSGSKNDPALGFDAFGSGAGNNNVCVGRYRAFDNPAISLRLWPCTAGNGTHAMTFYTPKVEHSTMEFQAFTGDAFQVGANSSDCSNAVVAVSDGTTATGFNESGLSGITFYTPEVTNGAIDTVGFHVKGQSANDVGQVSFNNGFISNSSGNNGIGVWYEAGGSGGGNNVNMTALGTNDYSLIESGAFLGQPVNYDGPKGSSNVNAYIDPGKNISCDLGLGLMMVTNAPAIPALYSCFLPNSALQNSSMTLNGLVASLGGSYNIPSTDWFQGTNSAVQTGNTTTYYSLSGMFVGGNGFVQNNVNNTPVPRAGNVTAFTCETSTAPGNGNSWTMTVFDNGSPTSAQCVVTGTNNKATGTGMPAAFNANDNVYVQVVASSGAASSKPNWTIELTH